MGKRKNPTNNQGLITNFFKKIKNGTDSQHTSCSNEQSSSSINRVDLDFANLSNNNSALDTKKQNVISLPHSVKDATLMLDSAEDISDSSLPEVSVAVLPNLATEQEDKVLKANHNSESPIAIDGSLNNTLLQKYNQLLNNQPVVDLTLEDGEKEGFDRLENINGQMNNQMLRCNEASNLNSQFETNFTSSDDSTEQERNAVEGDTNEVVNGTMSDVDADTSSSGTPIVCDVSPDVAYGVTTVDLCNSSTIKPKTCRKPTKTAIDESRLFIRNTIEVYYKYLKISNAFDGILEEESLKVLSKLAEMSDSAKDVVSYLYCVKRSEPEDMPCNEEVKRSLSEEFIEYTLPDAEAEALIVENCDILKLSDLKDVCSKFKLRTPGKKTDAPVILQEYIHKEDIRAFMSRNKVDKELEVLNELRSKLKKWQLLETVREAINELIVLMHLDSIFKMGCSIDPVRKYKDRPEINFESTRHTKKYPVDKNMIVDNASIIFQNRQEFCGYLEALVMCERTEQKIDFVLRTQDLYKNETYANTARYRALPPWLRKFTPADLYIKILADGVLHLKKAKSYDECIEILDLLITQMIFRQHKKADWYKTKVTIQEKKLKSLLQAAQTLERAFKDQLSEEPLDTLRQSAKHILLIKRRNAIDKNLRSMLQIHADKAISEQSFDSKHFNYSSEQKPDPSKRPKYRWGNESVSAEFLCCQLYKQEGFDIAEHWEGKLVTNIYLLLFWDIIYTKPLAIGGIFLSHYQQYPLDMMTKHFYLNREAIIEEFLTTLEQTNVDEIIELITRHYKERIECGVPDLTRSIKEDDMIKVVRCLAPRKLVAICRRLARNFEYTRYGFPDLTLCNTENHTIEFREVKTVNDPPKSKQLEWLQYLREHDIETGFCYLNDQQPEQVPTTSQATDNSHAPASETQT